MEKNEQLRQAWDFVENTGVSIFLTGRAGTGKTTFLRTVRERCPKRMVVVAPTGVAAINAGGMTIHSFFQLPLSPYIPSASFKARNDFSKEKRNIMRTLDLLVIDEISMVRSDLLDAVDNVLRRFRNPRLPFGGVQLLMIGDLQQLTPVVKADEEALLSQYYDTPYFFGSHALRQIRYVTLQLHHVYRQTDSAFLSLLNNIRDGRPTASDLQMLNSRCRPAFRPRPEDGFIRLTTHNRLADSYNEDELRKLPGRSYSFEAEVEGTFPEYSFPTDETLTLKKGAQVMFVKNDPSPEHLFYNGRIGRITSIGADHISVRCSGDDSDIDVEPLTWENAKYKLNPDTKEIETDVQGTFQQYPLRLAWAITIHKSQGLTFDHAIIDAGLSFAAGQVYVALSRCKTLDGLVLASPISPSNVFGDQRVAQYILQEEQEARRSIEALPQLKEQYHREMLCELFDFSDIVMKHNQVIRLLDEHFHRTYPRLTAAHRSARSEFAEKAVTVSEKWARLIASMSQEAMNDAAFTSRVERGAAWFLNILTDLLQPLVESTDVETDNKVVARRMADLLAELTTALNIKVSLLSAVAAKGFSTSSYLRLKQEAVLDAFEDNGKGKKKPARKAKPKSDKPATVNTTDIGDPELFEDLRNWRWEKSKELSVPPYTILQQKALFGIVNSKPATEKELLAIPYFGKVTMEKYGREILEIVERHR
ncbi:MAG: AAA family ATPase [Prevotella sp.]|nr:AAA family ATPase [Prevotella sp.]